MSDMQEALRGAESAGHMLSVASAAVYVGCMWGSEYLDVLTHAGVSTCLCFAFIEQASSCLDI